VAGHRLHACSETDQHTRVTSFEKSDELYKLAAYEKEDL
jgi:hypothetical protein